MGVDVSAPALILWALGILSLAPRWIIALTLGAATHELCHILALKCLGIQIASITLGFTGAKIRTGYMDDVRELLSALAGPMGSLMLLFTRFHFPELAFCGLVQGCFNLIPLPGFDGGRAVACLYRMIRSGSENTLAKNGV